MPTNPKKRRPTSSTQAIPGGHRRTRTDRLRIPPGVELDSVCAAICTRVIRDLQEETTSQLEILNDPRLIRLVISRARATGDIQGAFEDSIKALRRLRKIEERRR
jgi:hypothetical protein